MSVCLSIFKSNGTLCKNTLFTGRVLLIFLASVLNLRNSLLIATVIEFLFHYSHFGKNDFTFFVSKITFKKLKWNGSVKFMYVFSVVTNTDFFTKFPKIRKILILLLIKKSEIDGKKKTCSILHCQNIQLQKRMSDIFYSY